MKFEFSAKPRGGIKLIEGIDNHRLCWLEGRNGIGKTLAIRLLELITGRQPYADAQAAWDSLRSNLGRTEIDITELRNHENLRVVLTPSEWPQEPSAGTSLGVAYLDGKETDFLHVRDLLKVSRIAGDETIIHQFREFIRVDSRLVDRQNKRLGSEIEEFGTTIDSLVELIGDLSPQVMKEAEERLNLAKRDCEEAREQHQEAKEYARDVEGLDKLVATLEDLKEQGPDLQAELREAAEKIEVLDQHRKTLTTKQEKFLTGENKESLFSEQKKLLKRQEMQAARIVRERTAAGTILEEYNLSVDSDVNEELDKARNERADLERNKEAFEASPGVTSLIDSLSTPLEAIEGMSLDSENILVIRNGRFSARQVRDGLRRRKTEIVATREQSLLEELETAIANADKKIKRIEEAEELLQSAERAAGRLDKTERDIHVNSKQIEVNSDEEHKKLAEELKSVEQEYLELIRTQVVLRGREAILYQEGSESELSDRTAKLADDLGVSTTPAETVSEAHTQEIYLRGVLKNAEDELYAAKVHLSELQRRIAEVVDELEYGANYEWLRDGVGNRLPASHLDDLESLRRIDILAGSLKKARALTNDLENQTDTILRTLQQLSGDAPPLKSDRPRSYRSVLAKYYERQFGDLLNNDEVQNTLFEGGRFESLDYENQSISWLDINGEPKKRPLEAFSSGERAFAYMLASVLQHSKDRAENRVLVLDEFGAFVEAERLDRLKRFLRQRVLKAGLADQIVVILPLREEPEIGPATRRREQVEKRGYFMIDAMSERE